MLLDQQVRLGYIVVRINTRSRQRQRRPLHSFHPPSLPKRLCDLMHSELAVQNESGERHGQIFKEIPPSVQRRRCSTYTPLTPFSFGSLMISMRCQNPTPTLNAMSQILVVMFTSSSRPLLDRSRHHSHPLLQKSLQLRVLPPECRSSEESLQMRCLRRCQKPRLHLSA